jgi:hypothetical protein
MIASSLLFWLTSREFYTSRVLQQWLLLQMSYSSQLPEYYAAYQTSAGQVPAVGSQVGRLVGSQVVGANAALVLTTAVPVDGGIDTFRCL